MLLVESLLGSSSAATNPYVEDVFSTYLYTGNGSTQTITNGIDLSGKGGLVWMKGRSGATDHALYDTARGAGNGLASNTTAAQTTGSGVLSFSGTGFLIDSLAKINTNAATYTSWSFREQAKFFDVVTYTGNGVSNRTVSHSLGSVPGCIFFKITSTTGDWFVLHQNNGTTPRYGYLNLTSAMPLLTGSSMSTFASSATFSPGALDSALNLNGATYVAYLFAHDAGGFGATGTDNVISCGSFTTDSGGIATVNLGYEPQWFLTKRIDTAGYNWFTFDVMRGWDTSSNDKYILPNSSGTEGTQNIGSPTATGFTISDSSNGTYIYIAIRRGPMKTPTTGTSVFGLNARTGTGANATVTGGQTDDAVLIKNRGSAVGDLFAARLTGTGYLVTSSTAAEVAAGTTILQTNPWDVMDGVKLGSTSTITNASANTFINYLFRRAPGFFDVVCYTGTGANRTVSHNLGVAPELMIVKDRATITNWFVYSSATGATKYLNLNQASAVQTATAAWNDTAPTSSVFTVGTSGSTNNAADTFVAYLFATVAGVSKVFSYTGNGSSQTINCGFTGGARFVLIKRTDSTGSWTVFDSARGIVAGNDPALYLNSTVAEVTTIDAVDTDSSGFIVNQDATLNLNVNSATYVGLAIA